MNDEAAKERQRRQKEQAASQTFTCPKCSRVCASRIRLCSHQRACQNYQPSKNPRLQGIIITRSECRLACFTNCQNSTLQMSIFSLHSTCSFQIFPVFLALCLNIAVSHVDHSPDVQSTNQLPKHVDPKTKIGHPACHRQLMHVPLLRACRMQINSKIYIFLQQVHDWIQQGWLHYIFYNKIPVIQPTQKSI